VKKYFIIDFDSTFTNVEALDLLGEISLSNSPEQAERLSKIKEITDHGMDGGMSFRESLVKRLELLDARKEHLEQLVVKLKERISKSIHRNEEFFRKHAENIYILSNGFKEFIVPIVTEYGVKPNHVYANTFEFDEQDRIIGFDEDNILSRNNGKALQIEKLKLKGEVSVIGDGYTDYEIKEAGLASKFYAFTENVTRDKVLQKADHVAPSLDEVLYVNKMNTAISYPKNRIKVLLLENVHPRAEKILKEEGYQVEIHNGGMDEAELMEKIKDVSILGIRSKTQVTSKIIDNARRLLAVGAFCIGTNQIDLQSCLKKGIAVFNAPYSNTRSVVELAIAEIIMLLRKIPQRTNEMHEGRWLKSASNSFEIRGKKLGIIGYGNIGSQLSVLAENLGMEVYYFDLVEKLALGNVRRCQTMEELLSTVDVVSLHVDGRNENLNFFGKEQFALMKRGAAFINLSRGFVVDIQALTESLKSSHLVGAAVDVYPQEPKNNQEEFISPLRGLPNTILTPHIGGSTQEAQENIGNFVPNQIIEYINTGSTSNSVNFPQVLLPTFKDAHRLMHIHHNVPGILARMNQIFAKHKINIVGQYLKTNETIGYVITDIDKEYSEQLIDELKSIEDTVRFRVLY
jgi:D-3-phosphoglycerate dehydrogenase